MAKKFQKNEHSLTDKKRGPEQIFCIFSLKTNTWTDVCQEGFGKMYKHFSTVKFRHYDNTRPFIQDIPSIFPIPNFKKPSIDPFYGLFLCCF